MFDILLGWKFSNKCKHSVKYIKCRIEIIRKKKQVMVRYLKKDVADLLAGGHDANAFGRIDALVVEINHATCYDMIEQYCGCLLEHLSTMCKERLAFMLLDTSTTRKALTNKSSSPGMAASLREGCLIELTDSALLPVIRQPSHHI